MKKLTIIAAVFATITFGAQGQGLVNFVNSAAAGSKISTNSVLGGVATGLTGNAANELYYALFWSATATTVNGSASAVVPVLGNNGTYVGADANWTFSTGMATNIATPGRVSGNVGQIIPGLAGGSFAHFVVVGWTANLGATYAQAIANLGAGTYAGIALIGQSAVSPLVQVGDGVSVPNPSILAASGAVAGFTLGQVNAVPEPATIALAGLGGLALLALRRKK